jgi:hypothetical protein
MVQSVILLPSSTGLLNVEGSPIPADGFYGNTDGLHTIAIYVQNFTGRVYLQATLESNPTSEDWFTIPLADTGYIEYPIIPLNPTGQNGGDTGVKSFTFKINALYLRIKIDRNYLPVIPQNPMEIAALGIVRKVLLSR